MTRSPISLAEDREHDRPPDPVAEGTDRPDEREPRFPALVGVERDAAWLVGEHRRRLAVDEAWSSPMPAEIAHKDDGAPGPERVQGEAEERDHEPRVAHGDDEPVPPAQRLEELPLLDDRSGHAVPLPPGGPRPTINRLPAPTRSDLLRLQAPPVHRRETASTGNNKQTTRLKQRFSVPDRQMQGSGHGPSATTEPCRRPVGGGATPRRPGTPPNRTAGRSCPRRTRGGRSWPWASGSCGPPRGATATLTTR